MTRFLRLAVILTLSSGALMAQERPKRDSIYQKIENYSNKRKVSKFLYRLIFRNVPDQAIIPNTKPEAAPNYEGRHIRNIIIRSFDPLGYGSDMQKRDTHWYENAGNRLHRTSRNFAVRGYLLFKKGDEFNAQKIYESERILRDTRFISRVSIKAIDSTATKDSVDISVRVLDSWSLKPSGNYSGRKFGLGLTEDNFLGMGHQLSANYKTDFKTKQNYSFLSYAANNIYGTYINAKILGENDFDNNENVYMQLNREFFSPVTRWAGGVNVAYFKRNIAVPMRGIENPNQFPGARIKVHNQDFWGGYQVPVNKNRSEKITDNLVFAGRFQNLAYISAPDPGLDPGNYFQAYRLYLGSVGFTRRKFEVKKNIFSYEMPEDIPYGANISLTGGVMSQNHTGNMPYAGISAGYGTFTRMGYFNYRAQYGTFFRESKNYRGTVRVDGTYFTPLRRYGTVNLRHFLSQTLVLGNSRNPTYADRINISARDEFPEYNGNFIGKDKLILRYQLQLFINKPWKNFYINPYVVTALGWLSDDAHPLFGGKAHAKFGIGMHFYNPYLAFNRLQISFVFYPNVPFENHGAFNFNGYRNSDMPINNFSSGAPGIVNYSDGALLP